MKRTPKPSKNSGFTLLEMLIVIIIVSILLVVVLFNYRGVESKSILRNIAYEVALTVREAQSYGLGVKKYAPGGDVSASQGVFDKSYGVHVNDGVDEAQSVYLFSDSDDDGICDDCTSGTCPGTGECRQALQLHSGAEIQNICLRGLTHGFEDDAEELVNSASVTEKCSEDSDFYSAAVRFKRPNPDAIFTAGDDEGTVNDTVTDDIQDGGTMTISLVNPKSPEYVQNLR